MSKDNWMQNIESIFCLAELNKLVKIKKLEKIKYKGEFYYIKLGSKSSFISMMKQIEKEE